MAVYKVTVDEAVTTLGVTEDVTILSEQVTGIQGPTGQGLATGGTTNQVLAKNSNTNFDTKWIDAGGGGGSGTVTSITATAPLTGGVITTSGTIGLDQSNIAKLTANTFNAGQTIQSTGNASLVLDAGTGGTAGNQVSYVDMKINGTLKANIAINEGIAGTPLQLNSSTSSNIILAEGGGNVGIGKTPTTKLDVDGTVKATTVSVNGGNLYVQGPSAPVYFNYDAMTGDIDLTTGNLNTTGNVGGGTGYFTNITATNQFRLINNVGTTEGRFQGTFTGLRTITVPDASITIAGAGANSDITSLTGLTTALSTAQGGTGSTTSTGTGSNVLATNPVITKPTITRAVYQNAAPGTLTWTANASTIASSILTAGWMRIISANLTATGTLNLPSTTICAAFLTTNGEASDVIIINEASFAVTTTGVTGVTLTGNVTIAANSSATFRFYRTSSTAFVWVRIA